MGFEQSDELFRSDDIGFEVNDDLNLDDGELTGLPTVKVPKRSARERVEVKQGIRRDRLGRPTDENGEGDLVAPVRGVRLSGGPTGGHGFGAPMMSESSEFGYLFSDDEPTDEHMDEKRAERLNALAYNEAQDGDGEQYNDIFSADAENEPMVRRRSFNRRKTESHADAPAAQPEQQPFDRSEDDAGKRPRFARRAKTSESIPESRPVEPELPDFEPLPDTHEDTFTQPIPAPQPTDGGEAYIQPAPLDIYGQQPYGMYQQAPAPYQPMPYQQYGAPYGQPYQPYPPYQQGYPQVPYPQYMPMPYTPAPSVVVIPPMGGYYDPYEREELYESRRRRRHARDRYDDYDDRYPDERRSRYDRDDDRTRYDREGERSRSERREPQLQPQQFTEPVREREPAPIQSQWNEPAPQQRPLSELSQAAQARPSIPEETPPPAPRFSKRSTEPAPAQPEKKRIPDESAAGAPSPRFNKRAAAESVPEEKEPKAFSPENYSDNTEAPTHRFKKRGAAESVPEEKEPKTFSPENYSDNTETPSSRFSRRGSSPASDSADEAKSPSRSSISDSGSDESVPPRPRFNRR